MRKLMLAVLVAAFASTALLGCKAEIERTDAPIAAPR
jgi:hypothetical protein